jgi:hypothetical protein
VAFLGGLDLAYGRYDNISHSIVDNCEKGCYVWLGNELSVIMHLDIITDLNIF